MAVLMEVQGKYALYARPEMSVERVTYDVMTPSAARGTLESVFWHPGLRWIIDRIYVLRPLHFTNVRRNEVSSACLASSALSAMNGKRGVLALYTSQDIQQRAALLLQDVRYVIAAHFEMTERASASDNPGKFSDIMRRRLEKGQCHHTPYLGCREFPAAFGAWQGGAAEAERLAREALPGERDLGYMLYDVDYSNTADLRPLFFRAKLTNGVLEVAGREVLK